MDPSKLIKREPINRGWSGDRKYRLEDEEGTSYFIRLANGEKGSRFKEIFGLEEKLYARGLAMAKPLGEGELEGGFYILESWIRGQHAEELIPRLPSRHQFSYGFKAGEMLKLIHSLPAPENLPHWQERFNAKIDRNIRLYRDCPVDLPGADHLIEYISSNRQLLKDRPQCFQHGDYHIGNMMVEEGRLVIIDFDRFDYGDPWEEFNRIVWSAQASPSFARGLVEAYFEGEIPLAFWKLLALYISSNSLGSLAWAVGFGEKEIFTMKKQAGQILGWYKNMEELIPSWYLED